MQYKNYQGQSFVNKNLVKKDFTNADIRGANFTNANLTQANFTNAITGLQQHSVFYLILLALFLFAISGTGSIQISVIFMSTLSNRFTEEFTFIPAIIIFVSIIVFSIFTIRQGFLIGGLYLAITISIAVPLGMLLGRILAGIGPIALAIAWTPIVVFTTAIAISIIRIILHRKIFVEILDVVSGLIIFLTAITTWNILKDITQQGTGAVAKSLDIAIHNNLSTLSMTIMTTVLILVLGYYLGFKSIGDDQTFDFTKQIAVILTSLMGTSFRNSNLTDANFSQASINSTDFRNAVLTRTFFRGCRELNLARWGSSYLNNQQIKRLIVTGYGKNQKFDQLNLSGINLAHSNLTGASFIGTNLTSANLTYTNLTNALLVQTQLSNADMTGACLTGVVIQDWKITVTTKLESVECKYCYMRLGNSEDRDSYRKPDHRQKEFVPGEFVDFISPLKYTIDLYHNQKPNIKAVFEAFKRLVDNYPDEKLELVAIEKRGQDQLLLKVQTAQLANHSNLSKEYFENYNYLKSLTTNSQYFINSETDWRQVNGLKSMLIPVDVKGNFEIIDYAINQLNDKYQLKKFILDWYCQLNLDQDIPEEIRQYLFEEMLKILDLFDHNQEFKKQQIKISTRIIKGFIGDFTNSELIKKTNQLIDKLNNVLNIE